MAFYAQQLDSRAGVLTLKGEKRAATDDKDRQFSERFYGRSERRIPVGYEAKQAFID